MLMLYLILIEDYVAMIFNTLHIAARVQSIGCYYGNDSPFILQVERATNFCFTRMKQQLSNVISSFLDDETYVPRCNCYVGRHRSVLFILCIVCRFT